MSSTEGDSGTDQNTGIVHDPRARKSQRACDVCRRKKIRCDGSKMPQNRCTNCAVSGHECTYVEVAKKRGPPKSYVQSLENRVTKLRQLLAEISPEALEGLDTTSDLALGHTPQTLPPPTIPSRPVALPFIHTLADVPSSTLSHDDIFDSVLVDNLQDLSLGRTDRFFGKSSEVMLHQATLKLKHDHVTMSNPSPFIPDYPSRSHPLGHPHKYEYSFPEEDLLQSLIRLYFIHTNILYPLFHRPTFDKYVAEGLHLSNELFGVTVLLICAVASRYSEDPRVLLDDGAPPQSSGWRWFSQVNLARASVAIRYTVHHLQFYCLTSIFLEGSSTPQACWRLAGLGLRVAQDMGAHRRKTHNLVPTPEAESLKRVFWTLVLFDRMYSSCLGRPCAIQDEDYDVDLPIECDDEYWDHPDPEKRFRQPANKPSVITYFTLKIKLYKILAFALRTIYSVDKSKVLLGFAGRQWEESIVRELDTALNQFLDSVPSHLRWDPSREDETFFSQSASLYSVYYQVQMLVHRPFIPSRLTPLPFSSLAISTNAARSCSRIVDAQFQRTALLSPLLQTTAFLAGVVLLLNIWGGKRSGLTTDAHTNMEDVHRCMVVLKATETRWYISGRSWDILYGLASVRDMPLPTGRSSTNKRERDEDEPQSSRASAPIPDSTVLNRLTTQFSGMPRDLARPRHPLRSNIGSVGGSSPGTYSHLQRPLLRQHTQYGPSLHRTPSQLQHSQARQLSSQHFEPPRSGYQTHNLPANDAELDQLPLLHLPASSDQQQELPPYSASSEFWHWVLTGDKGDGMSSSMDNDRRQLSTTASELVHPPTGGIRPMPWYTMHDSLPYDAVRPQYSSVPYAHPPADDDQSCHYPSISTGASTGPVVDHVQQHPSMPSPYAVRTQSHVHHRQNMLENDAYTMWPTVSSGSELDAWGNYVPSFGYTTGERGARSHHQ